MAHRLCCFHSRAPHSRLPPQARHPFPPPPQNRLLRPGPPQRRPPLGDRPSARFAVRSVPSGSMADSSRTILNSETVPDSFGPPNKNRSCELVCSSRRFAPHIHPFMKKLPSLLVLSALLSAPLAFAQA